MLVEKFSQQTGLTTTNALRLSRTASLHYKSYTIKKINGGLRQISQPSKQIKHIQRWLIRNLFSYFPIHSSATAYFKGASILDNANRHLYSNFTVRLDFEEFFPSFTELHIENFLKSDGKALGFDLTAVDLAFILGIVCRFGRLTIGAPSSPMITNAMMFSFDREVARICEFSHLSYTRYADDIFISSKEQGKLSDFPNIIRSVSDEFEFANLRLKAAKTVFLSRRYRRQITGLNITPSRGISIGLSRKNRIKRAVYLFKNHRLDVEEFSWLKGFLAFVRYVEPTFFEMLIKKYGNDTISRICTGKYESS